MAGDWDLLVVPTCAPLPGRAELFHPSQKKFLLAVSNHASVLFMPNAFDESRRVGFPTTRWTLISRVRHGSDAEVAQAMEDLCRDYWYPIYAFGRRAGFSAHDAEDLTQLFFQNLVTSEGIREARQEEGRLRTFMLAMLKRVMHKVRRHDSAQKRGGGASATISFDEMSAEERYLREPSGSHTADSLFDRAWACNLMAAAADKLRLEYVKADNLETFEHLREFLPLGENKTSYSEAAAGLEITEASLRLLIHRMRKRYAKLIELEIAQTVNDAAEQKAELGYLMAALGAGT
jgi:DNA-directed RNA polymerase specialized sigma24 family protein